MLLLPYNKERGMIGLCHFLDGNAEKKAFTLLSANSPSYGINSGAIRDGHKKWQYN